MSLEPDPGKGGVRPLSAEDVVATPHQRSPPVNFFHAASSTGLVAMRNGLKAPAELEAEVCSGSSVASPTDSTREVIEIDKTIRFCDLAGLNVSLTDFNGANSFVRWSPEIGSKKK